jgi:A/G-specific adenine glycosylase
MRQRVEKDIWQGLNDFYLIETTKRQKSEILFKHDKRLAKSTMLNESKFYRHMLSHQKLMVKFITVRSQLAKKDETVIRKLGMNWYSKNQVEKIA